MELEGADEAFMQCRVLLGNEAYAPQKSISQRSTLKMGSMSSNKMPFDGKSGNWRSACLSLILRLPHVSKLEHFDAEGKGVVPGLFGGGG